MRQKRSFVLHLYVDSETPRTLVGDLQAIPEKRIHSFKSADELIELLIQLAITPPQPSSMKARKDLYGLDADEDECKHG